MSIKTRIDLDAIDRRLLNALQVDCSMTNQALAAQLHLSAPTCLRRVRRLIENGVIERQIAIVAPDAASPGLTALVEITLDEQAAERMQEFESRVVVESAVQQCYRVSPGPDFVLVIHVPDMAAYHALVHRLFTAEAHVRNVRTFFSVLRSKFEPKIRL
jgi:Lrp/AsnC family leucine-responsive transcriptional regulator